MVGCRLVSLLLGHVFVLCHISHGAIITPLPLAGKSKGANGTTSHDDLLLSGFVRLQPGTKIYFYTTEDEKLMIGPKLQSEEDVSILILNQDDDFKKFSQFKNSYIKPDTFSVMKNGVLVPKARNHSRSFTHDECNKCVYQSLKPTYYVKGFKNILIPVDVLYTKSTQEKLFRSLDSASLVEPDSWRTDIKVTRPKENEQEKFLYEESKNNQNHLKLIDNSTATSKWTSSKSKKVWHSPHNMILTEDPKYHGKRSTEQKVDIMDEDVRPDTTCNGEVTLFVLKSDGIFRRIPSDPFLPDGLQLSFTLLENLMFKPKFLTGSDLIMSYITGQNGNLIPHSENRHKVMAEDGGSVCFMLSENGGLFPVKDQKDENDSISYYFNGNLVHKSKQFMRTFSNSTSVFINNKKVRVFQTTENDLNLEQENVANDQSQEKKPVTKRHHLRKRSTRYAPPSRMNSMMDSPEQMRAGGSMVDSRMANYPSPPARCPGSLSRQPSMVMEPPMSLPPDRRTSGQSDIGSPMSGDGMYNGAVHDSRGRMYGHESMSPEDELPQGDVVWENPPLRPRSDIFTFDERGKRIRLIPEITENNDVVIYKLTCKGNLVRYPPCKEPEFGFNIHFQLLLDEFVLVPTVLDNKPYVITYVLQENGDLVPKEDNVNTFRKAPGSLIYYILGKNNVLFPVQQVIDMEGNVSFFYQDYFLLKMKDSTDKPLHFTTRGAPLFAFFNGFTMITISSKPRLNPLRGTNWTQLKLSSSSSEGPLKSIYLTGPKGELIKITPYKNKQGATVVYELDCNGIFYRSPKDKKKCIILRSYMLLKDGILLPSNDTSGYVYMMSKNGDLFPYLYPDGKIEAPLASSLKYVLCEKGILLPIKLEIIDNYICYIFKDTVIYKEMVYCKSCLDRLDEEQFEGKPKKSSCDIQTRDAGKDKEIKLFVNKEGGFVFYEKHDKVLKRYPSESVPTYLKYTMGSFQVKPDGSLYQVRYQNPSENVANLMLEPNGDLLEDTRNINNARSDYYVLDAKGNLIAVEAKKTKKNFYFYKNGVRICRVPIPPQHPIKAEEPREEKRKGLPFGKDPMGIMERTFPSGDSSSPDSRSLYIPIPLKSVSISEPSETCTECTDAEHKKNCQLLKDTLKEVSKGTSVPLALELELTDDIIQELKNWAAKCDKVLNRREVADDLRTYLHNYQQLRAQGSHS